MSYDQNDICKKCKNHVYDCYCSDIEVESPEPAAVPAAPSAPTEAEQAQGLPAAPDDPDDDPAFCAWIKDYRITESQKWLAWGAWCAAKYSAPPAAAPSEPALEGVKLDVIARSYGFELSADGEIHGLTAGDMGYEQTGIKLTGETLEAWQSLWPKDAPAAPSEPVAWMVSFQNGAQLPQMSMGDPYFSLTKPIVDPVFGQGRIVTPLFATPPAQDAGTGETRGARIDDGGCPCWKCIDERGGMSFSNNWMVLCPTCGNKRCPHAKDHRNACTNSNEPGQKGSAYENCAIANSGRTE